MKRFTSIALSFLLALTMVVSCITVASAADSIDVDTTKKGTLTLNKYDSTKVTYNEETRELENTDADGATVSGATFTAYRVLDLDGTGYSVDDAFKSSGITVADLVVDTDGDGNKEYPSYGTYGTTDVLEAQISMLQNYATADEFTGTGYTLTDNRDGTYTKSDLPLGVYLVVETEAPKDYVVNTQSFLVAIPQWNQLDNEWVYSVKAYPKDQSIDVTKKITDHQDGTSVDEDSYEIGDNIPYTVTAVIPNYGMSSDYPNLSVTQNLSVNYKDGDGTANMETGLAMYNNLNISFTDTLSAGLKLNGDINDFTVKAGSATLSGTKITDDDLDSTIENENTRIYTALKGAVKSLTDTSYTADNITTDTDEETYSATVTGDYDYAIYIKETADGTTLYLYVSWASLDSTTKGATGHQGENLTINYSAYLTNDAVQGTAYENEVTYSYANNPQTVSTDAYDPAKSTDTDETKTYTYGMELTKKLNGETTTIDDWDNITEVTFELYAGDSITDESTPIKFIKNNADGSYTLVNDDNATTLGAEVTSLTLTDAGKLIIKGLAAGTYQLKETKTVDGYSLLTAPVEIVVTEKDGATAEVTAKVQDSDENTVETLQTKAQADGTTADADKATFVLTVNNSANQFTLPLTGGMGLWIFTITGGVIMSAAIIVLVVNRKRKASK